MRPRLTTARDTVAYGIGAAPLQAGLLRYRPGATGSRMGTIGALPGYAGL